ncbi:nicotinate phosphoribosyltransferase [Rhodococcus sp. ACS1]|nr:nicotinate phosphoribosyltransferase [Rhodococcus sp. ACS1]
MNADGYKQAHRELYPVGTESVYSNWTNRGSRLQGVDRVVHFGLQAALQKYLVDEWEQFFAADEDVVVAEFQRVIASYLGKQAPSAEHIRALHRLKYLPLRIKALPEGTLVPVRVPTFTMEETIPEFFWLVGYVETVISASYWHRSTVATIAHRYRRQLDTFAACTSDSPEAVNFQAHDFSFRGQTSVEAAESAGAGHLLSFTGTDTLPAILFVERYYPGDNGLIGASIPATEHSVMCAGGRENELATFEHILDVHEDGPVAIVGDTWNLWDVALKILPALKDRIMARDGKVVIRPDSGNPFYILCGDWDADDNTPEAKGLVQLIWELFGGTVNSKGYKEIDPHIGIIYGDAITYDKMTDILEELEFQGFASTNVVFGVGSFTYQHVTRDTFASAVKATWAKVDGEGRNLLKDPITDDGTKKSATGRLAVLRDENGEFVLLEKAPKIVEDGSFLKTVWEDGKATAPQSFADVRRVLAEQA